MLRRLHRLLFAVIAVVVCLAVTGPFRGIAGVRASIAIAHGSNESNDAQRRIDVERSDGVDLEAIETEAGDEEDDALNDVAEDTPFALTSAEAHGFVRPHHVEIITDTSRASSRTTLARGPPA